MDYEKIIKKLKDGYYLSFSTDSGIFYDISYWEKKKEPFMIEVIQEGVLIHYDTYPGLEALLLSQPFDLTKFTFKRMDEADD